MTAAGYNPMTTEIDFEAIDDSGTEHASDDVRIMMTRAQAAKFVELVVRHVDVDTNDADGDPEGDPELPARSREALR